MGILIIWICVQAASLTLHNIMLELINYGICKMITRVNRDADFYQNTQMHGDYGNSYYYYSLI